MPRHVLSSYMNCNGDTRQGKMELAMGVAVGSATQVSMFVVPVAVLSGWIMVRVGGEWG